MNKRLTMWIFFALVSVAALAFSGCYTQVGVTREDGRDEEYAADDNAGGGDQDAVENDDNGYTYNDDDAWAYRPRLGFSYYYPSTLWPSTAFSMSYGNPWSPYNFYGSNYNYSNDPWCWNAGYGGYGYGGYSGYGYGYGGYGYGGYGYAWGYNPYYSYYGYPYYGYTYNGKPVQHGGRNVGNTRGADDGSTVNTGTRIPPTDRTGGFDGTMSTGMRSASGGSSTRGTTGNTGAPAVDATTRSGGSTRGVAPANTNGAPRNNNGTRNSTSRTGNSRVYRQRGGSTQATPDERGTSAPTYAPPSRDGGSQSGSSTRSAQPSVAPAPSAPPPSSGRGSAPANSGSSRGGSTRGGRPN
jgi:hypothetical protein